MSIPNASIPQIYIEFPLLTLDGEDLLIVQSADTGKTSAIKVSDTSLTQEGSEINFTWSSTGTYNSGEPRIHLGQWYISLIDNNTGNVPSSSPSAWALENKISVVTIKPWVSGIYTEHYSVVNVSNSIYTLKDTVTLPFNSVTSPDLDLTNWDLISGLGSSAVGIQFIRQKYNSSVTTNVDPGDGQFSLDSTVSASTFINIDNLTDPTDSPGDESDISAIIDNLTVGSHVAIQQITNPSKYALYEIVTQATNETGYRRLEVSFVSGPSGVTFDDGEPFQFTFAEKVVAQGQNSREVIQFQLDNELVRRRTYIMPTQITDIPGNGFTTINYNTAINDGNFNYTSRADISEVNTYFAGLNAGDQIVLERSVGLNWSDDLLVIVNLS